MKVLGVEHIHSHMNILKALTYPSITFHFSGPTEGAGDGILSVGLVLLCFGSSVKSCGVTVIEVILGIVIWLCFCLVSAPNFVHYYTL